MARRREELGIWIDEVRIADLIKVDSIGNVSCRYSDEALGLWPLNSPVISCCMPLGETKFKATPFFRGLLPEGDALRVMAEMAKVPTTDTFSLLERFGKDVAGALVISRETPETEEFRASPLDDESLEEAVEGLADNPLGLEDESELSLAGLQNKMLLVQEAGQWARPLRGMPSTHILKVDSVNHPGLVAAECLCLRLAKHLGLTSVEAEIIESGSRACLIVSRFDRVNSDEGTKRIHQEDLLQATGHDPFDKRARIKYEKDGGPGFLQMASILEEFSSDPLAELDQLVKIMTFTVLIGNADAHAKNLSLLHVTPENVELAPLYDTVPTALWPKLRKAGAMSIGSSYDMVSTNLSDIARESKRWGYPESRGTEIATSTAESLLEAVKEGVIPESSPVAEFISSRATAFLS